jgi:hypothetical protein
MMEVYFYDKYHNEMLTVICARHFSLLVKRHSVLGAGCVSVIVRLTSNLLSMFY